MAAETISQISEGIPVLGIALFCAILMGKFAKRLNIPKVTAFILVGIILGPSLLNLITYEIWNKFAFLNQVAFGLILFNIGGEFNKHLFKKIDVKQVQFVFLMVFLTFAIVSSVYFVFTQLAGMSVSTGLLTCIFLGIVSVEAAPPTTVLVMKEYDAKGALSQSVVIFLAIGTCFALIGTQIATMVFQNMGLWLKLNQLTLFEDILLLIWNILGAILIGCILGFGLSYWEQKEKKQSELLLVVATAIMIGQTLSYYLNIDPLMISLSLGFTVVNTSSEGEDIHKNVKEMGLSIYALFFVMAGAHIDLRTQLSTLGVLGTGYIISRVIGIYSSAKIAGSVLQMNPIISNYKGLSVLSHAGTAVAIALSLQKLPDASAKTITSVITACIFVFEIVGPFLLRFSLFKTGEAVAEGTKGGATSRANITFSELVENFLINLRLKQPGNPGQLTAVRDLIKKDIVSINKHAMLSEVTKFVKEQEQPIYPVIDEDGIFEGLINLDTYKNAMLESQTAKFTKAENLIGNIVYLDENHSYPQAVEVFHNYNNIAALPVIDPTTKKLLGVVYYKELVIKLKEHGLSISNIQIQ